MEAYFADLGKVRASGGSTGELSSYGPLGNLLNAEIPVPGVTTGILRPEIVAIAVLATTHGRNMAGSDFTVTNGLDFPVTWNFRHIANATMRSGSEQACRRAGCTPPVICAPNELLEFDHADDRD